MKIQTTWKVLIVAAWILVTAACGDDDNKAESPRPPETANPMEVTGGWSPDSVSYTCSNPNQCPDNQGVLLAVSVRPDIDHWGESIRSVYRCTGTLYEATKVISAGHCVDSMITADKIYFRTVEKPGRPSRTYRVKNKEIAKIFTSLESPDFGVFELSTPVTGVGFAHPDQRVSENLSRMIALVSNARTEDSVTDFVLDAVSCRNEIGFWSPVAFSLNPTVFNLIDCVIVGGNSGGAVVEPGDLTSVIGIVSYSNNVKDASKPEKSKKEKMTDFVGISNARCVSLPGWSRVENRCLEMEKNLMGRYRTAFLIQLIDDWKVKTSEKWVQSPASVIESSDAKIRFLPEATSIDRVNYASGEKSLVMGILPVPICFESDPKNETIEISVPVDLYELNGTLAFNYTRSANATARLTLRPVGGNRYFSNYTVSIQSVFESSSFTVQSQQGSRVEALKSREVVIEKCKGDEVSKYLAELNGIMNSAQAGN